MLILSKLFVTAFHDIMIKPFLRTLRLRALYLQTKTSNQDTNQRNASNSAKSKPFSEKIALVNGGSNHSGIACVHELLRCGVKAVMVTDTDEDKGRKILDQVCRCYAPNRLAFIRADLSDVLLLRNAFVSTQQHFCGLDIVVNVIEQSEKNKWLEEINKSLTGVVRSTLLGYEYLSLRQGGNGGTICNIVIEPSVDDSPCGPILVATKSFLVSFGEGMSVKFNERTGVKIITGFAENEKSNKSKSSKGKGAGMETFTSMLECANPGSVWTLQFVKPK